jgi:hypothetical protein
MISRLRWDIELDQETYLLPLDVISRMSSCNTLHPSGKIDCFKYSFKTGIRDGRLIHLSWLTKGRERRKEGTRIYIHHQQKSDCEIDGIFQDFINILFFVSGEPLSIEDMRISITRRRNMGKLNMQSYFSYWNCLHSRTLWTT